MTFAFRASLATYAVGQTIIPLRRVELPHLDHDGTPMAFSALEIRSIKPHNVAGKDATSASSLAELATKDSDSKQRSESNKSKTSFGNEEVDSKDKIENSKIIDSITGATVTARDVAVVNPLSLAEESFSLADSVRDLWYSATNHASIQSPANYLTDESEGVIEHSANGELEPENNMPAPIEFRIPGGPGSSGRNIVGDSSRTFRRTIMSSAEIDALKVHQIKAKNGMYDNKRKHRSMHYHSAKGTNAVTRLQNLYNSQYVGAVGVGTVSRPPGCADNVKDISSISFIAKQFADETQCHYEEQSTINVVFDTGSTNLWIASDLCDTEPCTNGDRHRYAHVLSETYHDGPMDGQLDIEFGTGELSGKQGVDDFHVGPFTVNEQTFGMIAREVGDAFKSIPFEGILGLAFPSMSANGVVPFFDNVITQKALKTNSFAFYFNMDEAAHTHQIPRNNALLWGGVDSAFYEGEIKYFPVTQKHYWALDLHEFRVGDESYDVSSGEKLDRKVGSAATSFFEEGDMDDVGQFAGRKRSHLRAERSSGKYDNIHEITMRPSQSMLDMESTTTVGRNMPKLIVDTGTTYFTAQGPLYHTLVNRFPTTPCDSINAKDYPPLAFVLQNEKGEKEELLIPQEIYMVTDQNGDCSLAFMQIDLPHGYGPGMLLGEVFLRHYFTNFQREDKAEQKSYIGFARAKTGDEPTKRLQQLTATPNIVFQN